MKKGDMAWVRNNQQDWIQVKIMRVAGNYYTVRCLDRAAAFGVPGHRIFSEEEYRKISAKEKPAAAIRTPKPPDLH